MKNKINIIHNPTKDKKADINVYHLSTTFLSKYTKMPLCLHVLIISPNISCAFSHISIFFKIHEFLLL